MLVHQCIECGTLSINRIAADDDPSMIVAVFRSSLESQIHTQCEEYGIRMLKAQDEDGVHKQLFGGMEVPAVTWSL